MREAPPVLWTATGFAAGAAASAALDFDRTLLLLALPIALWRGPKSRALALLICFLAGLAWAGSARHSQGRCTASVSDGSPASVAGYFVRSSAQGASSLRMVSGEAGGCRGLVRVYTRSGAPPPEARFVTVEGRWFETVRGDGSVSVYLSAASVREAVGHVPWAHRLRTAIRERAAQAIRGRLGSQAGVASALVLAEREGIPQDLWDAFARSGSAHLLSISGFHVGVIAALLGTILTAAGHPPRARAAGVAIGVWAYVLVIGAPTSATRAAWMTTAFVVGRLRQTPARSLGSLGLSMLMLTVFRPSVVAGAGFQLTVAGTAGILVLSRWIMKHWPAHPGRSWIAPPVAAGIGASVFTAPVLAYHFGQIPLLSLPSSILLTPMVAAAVPGVLLAIVLDVLGLPGAGLAGAGSEGLLQGVTSTAAVLGSLPGTTLLVTPREAALLTVGALLPLAFGTANWRTRPVVRAAVAVLSAGAVLWLGQAALSLAGRGSTEIVAIDVGQGDAIGVRTPRGRWLLVDAGPRFGGSDAGLTRVVPYLRGRGVRRLEAIVLTHSDEDHAGGLASVLRNISVGTILGPGFGGGQAGHMAGLEEARRAGVPWRRAAAGDSWEIDGVTFRVLSPGPEEPDEPAAHPRSPNDWSVVLRVTFGHFDALLMGDADAVVEARLLDQEGIEVLKVGHHGSRTSTSEAFVRATSPRLALVSAGARNRYGHPDPGVLKRLERAGARIFRTDRNGSVAVTGREDGTVTVRTGR